MTSVRFAVDALSNARVGPVSFALRAGECIAIMGASGAGKTVLLRLLADLDPGEGRVELDGQPRDAMPATTWRKRVGYVPAVSGWWGPTVIEHFTPATTDRATTLCAAMRLPTGILDRQVIGLSTGEKQRLALVRAMVEEPAVLLLDEPTSGLDAPTALAVEACLAEQRARGAGIVIVSHDHAQALRMASQVHRLENGRLHAECMP
ncbi:ABC transporter ATP-binding protein [Bacillus sp. NP157]|nr:ABC transporter ATP-binding protein [Bacillus sp. NP157]